MYGGCTNRRQPRFRNTPPARITYWATMPTLRLPPEIWELVLDYCRGEISLDSSFIEMRLEPVFDTYATLCACCLVSRAWLPRGRLNLYSTVIFQHFAQVERLLAALSRHPFLADHVHTLCVYADNIYIPFARSELVRQLRCVRTLVLNLDWRLYPPQYLHCAAQYPITELYYWGKFRTTADICRVLYAFPNISCLSLEPWEDFTLDASHVARLGCKRLWHHFDALEELDLGVRGVVYGGDFRFSSRSYTFSKSRLVPLTNFPPPHALGTSILILTLQWSNDRTTDHDPRALLDYVSSLHQLRVLTLEICTRNYDNTVGENGQDLSTFVTSVISSARTHVSLHRLRLCFWMSGMMWRDEPVSRHFLLSKLFTPAFKELICRLPALRELVFELPPGPESSVNAAEWWTTRFRARLRFLKAEISVAVHPVVGSALASFWIPLSIDHPGYRTPQEHFLGSPGGSNETAPQSDPYQRVKVPNTLRTPEGGSRNAPPSPLKDMTLAGTTTIERSSSAPTLRHFMQAISRTLVTTTATALQRGLVWSRRGATTPKSARDRGRLDDP
ncbi:hypothetical protein C8Q79DRAFT_6512 [Trametes meyenii]|nr:hypothetical protein C8Q79DRAFT_6512 [Trametes meyenii]